MKTPTLFTSLSLTLSFLSITTQACQPPDPAVLARHRKMNQQMQLQRRQNNAAAPGPSQPAASQPAASAPAGSAPPAGITSAPAAPPPPVPTDPFAVIPPSLISAGSPPEVTPPFNTPQAGAQPPVSGAPPLPAVTLTISAYPPENTVPPVNSPQVAQWMKEIQGIDPNILNMRPTVDGSCANDTAAAADASRCWWTCGGCSNSTSDIVTCPDKNTWGVSFDDGPAIYTPKVIKFLADKKLTGTFFVVGSRILERPAMLQAEYMAGHHISVHTWSHSIPLTALSNAQVVAELGWGRQIIKEVLGITPLTFRPPWGDIDNRVRAIAMAMGLRPIIWTREPTTLAQFDTNDWRVVAGQVSGTDSVAQFQNILTNASLLPTGFIVLEHDLFQQEVDLSTGTFIPEALDKGFKLMDINSCQHLANTEAYLETIQNKSGIPTYPGAGQVDVSGDGSSDGGNPAATGSPSSGGNSQGGASNGNDNGTKGSAGVKVGVSMLMLSLLSAVAGGAMVLL